MPFDVETTSSGLIQATAKSNSHGQGTSTNFASALGEPNKGVTVKCKVATQKIGDVSSEIEYSTDFCELNHYSVCHSFFPPISMSKHFLPGIVDKLFHSCHLFLGNHIGHRRDMGICETNGM